MTPINREELAWAAGFFDGEGHVRFDPVKDGGIISLRVAQNEPTILKRFHDAVLGIGNVKGPYGRLDGGNPYWRFECTNFEGVQAIVAMLWTFLSLTKKGQARKVLEAFPWSPIRRHNRKLNATVCRYGHSLEGAYVRVDGYRICRNCEKIKRLNRKLREITDGEPGNGIGAGNTHTFGPEPRR
jgi:hypothetical protein